MGDFIVRASDLDETHGFSASWARLQSAENTHPKTMRVSGDCWVALSFAALNMPQKFADR
jgi:hypothetical protein